MKSLVIFYSLEGNCKFLAQEMAEAIGADLLELKPEKDISSSGFMKYIWGGKQVLMKEMPKLLSLEKNPNDYDLIIIGSPVWAGNFVPAFKTFFSQQKIKNKKIGVFCSCGGTAGNTIKNLKEELKENEILGEIVFAMPLKSKDSNMETAKEWARNMANKMAVRVEI